MAAVIGVIRSTAVSDSKLAGLSGSGAQRAVMRPSARPHSVDFSAGSAIALVSAALPKVIVFVPAVGSPTRRLTGFSTRAGFDEALVGARLVRGAV